MKVLLVNMPWSAADCPSLALGIFLRTVPEKIPGAEVRVLHANIDYIDWITSRCDFGFDDYRHYSSEAYFSGSGDWVFSSALYEDPAWRIKEFEQYMAGQEPDSRIAMSITLHQLAPMFISELAERIAARSPDVVGFTTTFQQNTAALAAARDIKRIDPGIVTVFGGANCDSEQGAALHRNFSFVDFVVRGEGEAVFPRMLQELHGAGQFAAVPGLCWRRPDGSSAANPMATSPLPPAAIGTPDFGDYFDRVAASAARNWSEPKLVLESSRGCWWGEKHHCTFCGLNGSFMQFRSKPADVFVAELLAQVERHKVLDITIVDNILEMDYLTSAMPRIAAAGYDLRLHYEIKSNMRRDQLRTLLAAGVTHVQPGIESLSSKVLKLMNKGVTGCQNVRLLRDAESLGMQTSWNYLHGFPGEDEEDYRPVIDQFPALHHLSPAGSADRIMIERFSPYYDRPDLGFTDLRAAPHYRVSYDLPDRELQDLAYLFSAAAQGVGGEVAARLDDEMRRWKKAYYGGSRLTHCDLGTEIILVSTRPSFDWRVLALRDPVEVAVFRLLDQPHTAAAAIRKLAGLEVSAPMLADLLARWQAIGLVFAENNQFIHVACAATNQELQRLNMTRFALAHA